MIISAHAAVGFSAGILIAENIKSPEVALFIGFFVGVVFHYLTDSIPHGHISVDFNHKNFYQFRLVMLDLFGGFLLFSAYSLFLYGLSLKFLVAFITIGASLLTDIINGLMHHPQTSFLSNKLFIFDQKIHKAMHWHGTRETTRPMKWYDAWQVLVVLAGIYLPLFIGLI